MTERTMGGVTHTHRDDPRNVFAEMFRRGASTTTDGGQRTDEANSMADEADNMADVNHESPEGADANDVWARGQRVGSPDR